MMKKIILFSACLVVLSHANTAFVRASDDWPSNIPRVPPPTRVDNADTRADAERWAEARAERDEARAAERAAYEKALNEAKAAAQSSRANAKESAGEANIAAEKLAQARSTIDAAAVDAAKLRVQEALKNREEQTARLKSLQAQLESLQRWTNSINVQVDPSFDTAVRLNEEDLYKKISPVRPTLSMYQQAQRNLVAQEKELEDLHKQLIVLTTLSHVNEYRISLEKQIQSKATFGLVSDLLALHATVFDKADKKLKIAYEAANSAVALYYTATAPDYVERTKNANESVNSLISLYNEAALNPTLAKDPRLKRAVNGMALALKITNFVIDQNSKDNKDPVKLPTELCNDYIKLSLDLGGVFFPEAQVVGAFISLNERTDQYVHAENAMKQITKMKGQGVNAEEYLKDRQLQVTRNKGASEDTIKKYEQGDRK